MLAGTVVSAICHLGINIVNILKWARTQWDRVAAWVLIGLGGIAIVLGWSGVSSEALVPQQVPYIISGGIGGLFLLGVGMMLWLSADLRDEWRKLDDIGRNSRDRASAETDPDQPLQHSADGERLAVGARATNRQAAPAELSEAVSRKPIADL